MTGNPSVFATWGCRVSRYISMAEGGQSTGHSTCPRIPPTISTEASDGPSYCGLVGMRTALRSIWHLRMPGLRKRMAQAHRPG